MKEEWIDMNDCIVYTKFGHFISKDVLPVQPLFTKIKDPKTLKYTISPSIQQTKEVQNIIIKNLVLNDYPYYVEENIQHWCLWKLNDKVNDEDIEIAIEDLKRMALHESESESDSERNSDSDRESDSKSEVNVKLNLNDEFNSKLLLGPVIDTISWINPKHLQSIPDIDHAHILCLRETIDKKS